MYGSSQAETHCALTPWGRAEMLRTVAEVEPSFEDLAVRAWGVSVPGGAPLTEMKEVYLPFANALLEELAPAGFSEFADAKEQLELPGGIFEAESDSGPTMVAGPHD